MAAYFVHLAILAGISIIPAVSLNLIIGFAGQVFLGHVVFYGIGAYASTLTAWSFNLLYPVPALMAMLAGGLCGLALGLPTRRLREDYLVIVTWLRGHHRFVIRNLDITAGRMGSRAYLPRRSWG